MNTDKMTGKDYISCGIFSALCMVAMLIAAVMNISGYTTMFYPTLAAFFIGILYVIVCIKVPKKSAILVFDIVPCLYLFANGVIEGVIGSVGIILVSIVCEFMLAKKRTVKFIYISGIIYSLYLSVIGSAECFVSTDTYCENALAHGINEVIVEQMRVMFSIKALWAVEIAATALTMLLGMVIGQHIIKKHLKKAGIV